jgi:hypothetical protein
MAVVARRSITGLLGLLVAGIVLLAAGPVAAQVPPGAQSIPLVGGGIVATCPPGVAGGAVQNTGTATVGGVTVGFPARAACTPLSADAEGSYSIAGFAAPLLFTSECANSGGVVTSRSGVTVPGGTIVNGVAVAGPTVVGTPNASVIFPGGRTAILNRTTTTPQAVTQDAIVFSDGTIVGRVICGTAIYPLAVGSPAADVSADVAAAPVSSGGDGGPSTAVLLLGGAVALALLAQVAVGRTMWRRRNSAGATG